MSLTFCFSFIRCLRLSLCLAVLVIFFLKVSPSFGVDFCDEEICYRFCGGKEKPKCEQYCTKKLSSCTVKKQKIVEAQANTPPKGDLPTAAPDPRTPAERQPANNGTPKGAPGGTADTPDRSGEARGSQTTVGNTAQKAAGDKTDIRTAVRDDLETMGREGRNQSRLAVQRAIEERRAALAAKADSERREATERNLRAARKAKQAAEGNGTFTRRDASQVDSPEIRDKLMEVAFTQEVKEELEKEEQKLSFDISQLLKLAATAMNRGQGMGSMPSETGGKGPLTQTPPLSPTGDSGAKGNPDRTLASESDRAGISEEEPGKALADANEAALLALEAKALEEEAATDGKGSKAKIAAGALRQAIRAKYAKMLKDRQASEGLAADQFEGKLTSLTEENDLGGSADAAGGRRSEGAFDVAATALKESSDSSASFDPTFGPSSQFSMRASETEAEIKNFMEEGSRELASTPSSHFAGILEGDSPSLFERVRSAHKSCLKRRCIRL